MHVCFAMNDKAVMERANKSLLVASAQAGVTTWID
jgi:hypothetical protein